MSRFGPDSGFGIAPVAVAALDDGLIAVGSTNGNDSAFFHSADGRTWTTRGPAPVFDDGESPIDVACAPTVCVTVGERHTTGGLVGGTRRAITWTSSDGEPWVLSDGVFGAATVVAFGRDLDTNAIVIWTSDGTSRWQRTTVDDNAASGSRIRAITIDGNMTAAAGVDTAHDGTAVWTSQDMRSWRKTIVTDRTG